MFLIFTSQAWNMTLGVFEAIRTIPNDSIEALQAFGVRGWLRLRRLYLPAMVPKLVYNSILSWVAGWYFLIACEIITVGPAHYRLPGLGSYLMEAADRGENMNLVSGLITLADNHHADGYRGMAAADGVVGEVPLRVCGVAAIGRDFVRHDRSFPRYRPCCHARMRTVTRPIARAILATYRSTSRNSRPSRKLPAIGAHRRDAPPGRDRRRRRAFRIWRRRRNMALLRTLSQPWPPQVKLIPLATFYSSMRMIIAYAISLAWTLPVALAASDNIRFRRIIAPIAEIVGSLPATALFPVIVVFVIKVTGGMNLASILLILTGMQWYLMFNLLAGVNQVPEDLKEAARAFGLSRVATWRKLTIPALTPSLITGSITAWGGGWNALILSEYFIYRNHTYQVTGLGQLLDVATYETGNGVMILLSLLSMVAVVLILNHFIWRRLYDIAAERFRIDY